MLLKLDNSIGSANLCGLTGVLSETSRENEMSKHNRNQITRRKIVRLGLVMGGAAVLTPVQVSFAEFERIPNDEITDLSRQGQGDGVALEVVGIFPNVVSVRYQLIGLDKYFPRDNNDWIGIWMGPTNGDPLGKAHVRDNSIEGVVSIEMLNVARRTSYTVSYFMGVDPSARASVTFLI